MWVGLNTPGLTTRVKGPARPFHSNSTVSPLTCGAMVAAGGGTVNSATPAHTGGGSNRASEPGSIPPPAMASAWASAAAATAAVSTPRWPGG